METIRAHHLLEVQHTALTAHLYFCRTRCFLAWRKG